MADLEEVVSSLASTITGIINANGAPAPIKVISGWPLPDDLDAITKGNPEATPPIPPGVVVSVYAQPGAASNVTRFQWDTVQQNEANITTTATIAAGVITFGGTITLPLNVSIFAGGQSYSYAAQSSDTIASIITQLSYLIQNVFAITIDATTITFANPPPDLIVYLGGQGTMIRENARSKQNFQVTTWAPNQPLRMATVKAFEPGLFALNYIDLPDGTAGMLLFMREVPFDAGQVDNFYRRDVIVTVEYGITEIIPAWTIVQVTAPITH
jgi:hypothetical protein